MKSLLLLSVSIAIATLFSSCGSSVAPLANTHQNFKARADYKQSYDTYTNEKALATVNKSKVKLRVSKANQRMIVTQDNVVLMDTPITTGRPGKPTPNGTFKLYNRVADKRSNSYGTMYKNGVRVCGGHRRDNCKGVSYDKYVGSPLPYWQRIDDNGIGIHQSNSVKRYPASGGCIRIQPGYAKRIFNITKSGTPITITNS